MSTRMIREWHLPILLGSILLVGAWFAFPHKYLDSDPAAYSEAANLVAGFDLSEYVGPPVFAHRLGLIAPVGIIYKLFGVSLRTMHLFPLLSALLILFIVVSSFEDASQRFIAALVCGLNVPLLASSVDLWPDLPLAAQMGASTFFLVRRYGAHPAIFGSISSTCFIWAGLIKTTAIWLLPLPLILMAWDWSAGRDTQRFWIAFAATGLVLLLGYIILACLIWGHPLARLHAITGLSGQHLWSGTSSNISVLIRRLTLGPLMLLWGQFGLVWVAVVLSCFLPEVRRSPWLYYTVLILGFFWFGSASFSRYEPLPLERRMLIPALPGLLILATHFLGKIRLTASSKSSGKVLAIIFIALLLLKPWLSYVRDFHEPDSVDPRLTVTTAISDMALKNPDHQFIIYTADSRTPRTINFFWGYAPPANVEFSYWEHLPQDIVDNNTRILLYSDHRLNVFTNNLYSGNVIKPEVLSDLHDPMIDTGKIKLWQFSDTASLHEKLFKKVNPEL